MQTLESLQRKIEVARDLLSVVKTMKTLAAVAIRQYEQAVESLVAYDQAVEMGFQVVLRHRAPESRPLRSDRVGRLGVVLLGSDQGMCGQFNEQIVSFARARIEAMGIEPKDRILCVVGARAAVRFEDAGYRVDRVLAVPGSAAGIAPVAQRTLVRIERWLSQRRAERIVLFHNRRRSGAAYGPHELQLLPRDPNWFRELRLRPWRSRSLPAFTMSWERLFSALIDQYLFVSLHRAFAESLASENASRIASMQAAENNITERLGDLNRDFNQLRQTSITTELLDIVSGAEALRRER